MRHIIIAAILLLTLHQAIGQIRSMESAIRQSFRNTEGSNDRKNWAGMLAGFVNGTNQDKQGTITIHPTLYFLTHAGNILRNDTNTLDARFKKQWFVRNFQFDLGLTPDNKNQLKVNNSIEGFTFAILTNKNGNKRIYEKYTQAVQLANAKITFWAAASLQDTVHASAILNYVNNHDTTDILNCCSALVQQFEAQFHVSHLTDAIFPRAVIDDFAEDIKKQPVWTISGSHNYGYVRSHSYLITLSTSLQLYLNKKSSLVYNFSYTWGDDTTQLKGNYGRKIWSTDIGVNFKCKSWLEVKPTAGYSKIVAGNLFKDEHKETPNVAITPSLKVTDKLWLPITIKYDPWHSQFFGFLSVQYSLK